jgi:hypothetical protein
MKSGGHLSSSCVRFDTRNAVFATSGPAEKGEERSLIIFLAMVSKQQKKIENIVFPPFGNVPRAELEQEDARALERPWTG